MDADFWHARWQAQEIGFHQDDINVHLQQYWPVLNLPAGATVFVPLCGKSRDMLWLASQGYQVIGIEISSIAVEAFFADNDLNPSFEDAKHFRVYRCDELEIIQGDFFDLTAADLTAVSAVFDRASLIALPDSMRQRYAQHLSAILPAHVQSLLVTLNYPQAEMDGPPFAVSEPMVQALFADAFAIRAIQKLDILAAEPRFRERGLTQLEEQVFLLSR